MKHSERTVKKHLMELRKLIEESKDPILVRIAYEMETAVRWATEDVVDWPGLAQQAAEAAQMLREELKNERRTNERVDCVELLKQVNFDMMNVYRAGMGLPPMEDK